MLDGDVSAAIAYAGTQVEMGHYECCMPTALAYGDCLAGTMRDHYEYGCGYANQHNGPWEETDGSFYNIRQQLDAGHSVIIFVTGYGSSEHWILAIGYTGECTSADDLVALDPLDGVVLAVSDRYYRYEGDTAYVHGGVVKIVGDESSAEEALPEPVAGAGDSLKDEKRAMLLRAAGIDVPAILSTTSSRSFEDDASVRATSAKLVLFRLGFLELSL